MTRALLLLVTLASSVGLATTFRNPFNPTQCGWTGGCYVTAYFDLNRANGVVRDWACGTHTYDNHTGVDMGIGGFTGMNQGRDVLAAADGVVIGAHDGEFDQCTSGACGAPNYVWIKHPDGKVSLYYHLRKNSIVVSVGQTVTCGQKLGQVGSSGYSTGPHLHFQVNTVQGDPNSFDDPFAATAGCGGSYSWWVSQGGYKSLPAYSCEPKPQPDVQVTSVALSPAAPIEGQPVQLSAVVKNTGNAVTGININVRFTVDGVTVGTGTAAALVAGASSTATASTVWTATSGAHVVEAFADHANALAESNEGNNKLTANVTVAALPDLVIDSLTLSAVEASEGDTVAITAQVSNKGGSSAGPFAVELRVGGETLLVENISDLAPNATQTISATWIAAPGTHELSVVVDPTQTLAEASRTNNLRSASLEVRAVEPQAPTQAEDERETSSDEQPATVSEASGGVGCAAASGTALWLLPAALVLVRRARVRTTPR